MKRKRLHRNMKASIVLALLMVMVLMCKNDIGEVHAGASDIVIDNTSFAETLNESKWNSPNGDIEIKDAKLIFGAESTEETRLITTEAIQKSDYHEEWFHVSSTLNIKKIPEGQRFIFALGLGSVESFYEEDDSVEISFENKGGLQVGISAYTEDGTVSLCDLKRCGISLGKAFNLYISATKEGKLTVKVGSTTIYSDIPPIELEGRVGILQTGECEAEISQLSVVSHKYERPENTDVTEDFETGTMNINKITSSMTASCGYFPTGVQVEDYNGSKVLMFRNAGTAYLATKYMYSNFEMSFDVPYMQSNIVRNEDGTVSIPAHTGFAVSIGSEKERYTDTSYSLAAEAIVFKNNSAYSYKNQKNYYDFGKNVYYDAAANEGYSVKITVIDTQMTVYIKPLKADAYEQVLSYKLGHETPMGYVHIWSMGRANFAVDNLKIVNLDKDPKVLELDYKEGFITGTEDWEYQETQAEYLKQAATKEKQTWLYIVGGELAVGIIAFVICLLIVKRKKHHVKGEDRNVISRT